MVRHDGDAWVRYDVEDGLMDRPGRLIATRKGLIWASGSHAGRAATARFDGRRWSLETHPRFAILIKGVCEASDGTLWFGSGSRNLLDGTRLDGGVLCFDGREWTSHLPPQAPNDDVHSIAQTTDGTLWFGGQHGLYRLDGQDWMRIADPEELGTHTDRLCAAL